MQKFVWRDQEVDGNPVRQETQKGPVKQLRHQSKLSLGPAKSQSFLYFILKLTNIIIDKAFSVDIKDNLVLVLIDDFVK